MRDGAHKIVELLRDHGYEAYFAGGCVRDLLLGSEPKDYDIATSARPDEVASIFHKTRKVGQHFGVVLVRMKGHEYEVATFRSDGPYSDGRHPDHVTFSDAEHDVLRRDFTINGLLYDPLEKRLLDYVEGQRDLDARTVRAIGEPERRFREDALRLLRAVRFAMRLEYEIEPETFAAIRRTASLIHCVSRERIRDELWQIFETPPISRALRLLDESTLLEQLFVGMPRAHHDRVRDRIATLLPCEGPLLALALVIVGWLEGEEVSDVAQNLRLSRHETRDLLALVEQQPRWQQYGELPLAARRRLLRLDGVEVHLVLLESVLRAEG
ncbi:MAG: CCA tRNA nucleotidyltransferase, partial [Myxococcales bacterium]|nr:CCA tRNA nucleotidyltransferase [Myxococcales bacterium]